ncbi:MAG: rhomboid family intramembrane serine protease [Deltaproteobacteria bacterium]|nr:rhomboid family intramembrane serine protease [Deltaproteobacteria bacterium]
MRDSGDAASQLQAAFPRPGRTLKAVLVVLAVSALTCGVLSNWAGDTGRMLVRWLVFEPRQPERAWTFLTSGLVMIGFSHALWSILGLYFFAPDLEKSWGGARLLRFLAASVFVGNLAVLLVHRLAPGTSALFHPQVTFGPMAMMGAVTVAWAKENAHRQIRFMFFFPMSGRTLYWVTIAIAALMVVFAELMPEGVVAPFGGIAVGVLMSGSPSPLRRLWLRLRLGALRRQGAALTVEDVLAGSDRPRPAKRRAGGPALRVVPGGLEEDLKNRKPPKDKRFLN